MGEAFRHAWTKVVASEHGIVLLVQLLENCRGLIIMIMNGVTRNALLGNSEDASKMSSALESLMDMGFPRNRA